MLLLLLSVLSFTLQNHYIQFPKRHQNSDWHCLPVLHSFWKIGIFMLSSALVEMQSTFPFCPVSEPCGFQSSSGCSGSGWPAGVSPSLSTSDFFSSTRGWDLSPEFFLRALKQYPIYSWLPGWPFQPWLLIYSADVCWALGLPGLFFMLKRRWWTWQMQCLLPDESRVRSG